MPDQYDENIDSEEEQQRTELVKQRLQDRLKQELKDKIKAEIKQKVKKKLVKKIAWRWLIGTLASTVWLWLPILIIVIIFIILISTTCSDPLGVAGSGLAGIFDGNLDICGTLSDPAIVGDPANTANQGTTPSIVP